MEIEQIINLNNIQVKIQTRKRTIIMRKVPVIYEIE